MEHSATSVAPAATATLGLYIHVPFCRHPCAYCDFYFKHSLAEDESAFSHALIHELREQENFFSALAGHLGDRYTKSGLDTIYIGGGTPSLLAIEKWRLIFKALRTTFRCDALQEVTLEVNPEDLSEEKLAAWVEMGITRLSIGVQSFRSSHGKYLGRKMVDWPYKRWQAWTDALRRAGIQALTMDLIYGFPSLTLAQWKDNLSQLVDLGCDHSSLYHLTVEKGTRLEEELAHARKEPLSDAAAVEQIIWAEEMLATQDIFRYELSNFAKLGQEALHNKIYWEGGAYLGLGPSAHSFNGIDQRIENPKNLVLYMQALASSDAASRAEWVREVCKLSLRESFNERIIARLRSLRSGLCPAEFAKHFSQRWCERLEQRAAPLISGGYLDLCDDGGGKYWLLSAKGRLFADHVMRELLETSDMES